MILSREKLFRLLEAYPRERQHALAVFQDIQKACGYLPKEHIEDAAAYLSMPLSQAYAMVTFYRAFSLEPRGKHIIKVCDGTACHIRGSKTVLARLTELLGIEPGGTDADGLFTVEVVNCVGACAMSPVMLIGQEYFGSLTDDAVSSILSEIRSNELGEAPI
jgi:NADH-quinone oxidoreductase subunit E